MKKKPFTVVYTKTTILLVVNKAPGFWSKGTKPVDKKDRWRITSKSTLAKKIR